jgi:hypothetical protein
VTHTRLTIEHDDTASVVDRLGPLEPLYTGLEDDEGKAVHVLCDCGLSEQCNLACLYYKEVEAHKRDEPLKLLGHMELEPGEYIHNGKVWYCADRLGGA